MHGVTSICVLSYLLVLSVALVLYTLCLAILLISLICKIYEQYKIGDKYFFHPDMHTTHFAILEYKLRKHCAITSQFSWWPSLAMRKT